MRLPFKKINEQIEHLALDAVMLDSGDIPQLGEEDRSHGLKYECTHC